MESPEGAKYELLVIVATIVIGGAFTYITKKQRERIRRLDRERRERIKALKKLNAWFK